MKSDYISIQPEYVGRFSCDGRACGSMCCRGWHVAIDPAAWERFQRAEPESLRKAILARTRFNAEIGSHEFLQDDEGRCAFLREDSLCSMQLRCGEAMLADSCAEYPRKTHILPGAVERALCFTCPLAARLALTDSEPMRLETMTLSTSREAYFQRADDAEAVRATGFLDVQAASLAILQNRVFSIDARLMVLGSFLSLAGELADAGRADEISRLGELYTSPQTLAKLRAVPFRPGDHARRLLSLASSLAEMSEDDDEATVSGLDLAFRAFGGKSNGEVRDRLSEYRGKVLLPYGYMFENYLVNEFFMELYPCMTAGSFIHNYKIFVSLYKEMELFLASADFSAGDAAEEIIRRVRWLSVRTNHFVGYIGNVEAFLAEHDEPLTSFMGTMLDSGER